VGENEAWRLIRKAGWDSVPAVRCAVIDCLSKHEEPVPLATIQEDTGLPERTVARVAEDIAVLRLAHRFKDSGKWLFEESEIARKYWHGERLPETSDPPQQRLPETSEGLQIDEDEVERLAALAREAQQR
jgi:hypothetical protein